MSGYDEDFYRNRDKVTRHAAHSILPLVLDQAPPIQSAVDVGCGVGTWLSVLVGYGITDIQGIDGPWVEAPLLQIPAAQFRPQNLTDPIDLPRRFDLAISLEVAEHLPEGRASLFVESLARLSDIVLFSAAIPGQGGTNHLNEQWQDYWAEKFYKIGYYAYDVIRPAVWFDERIPYWYRQNCVLYAKLGIPIKNYSRDSPNENARIQVLNLVHPEQYIAKDKDRLGVRGSFQLLMSSLKRSNRIRSRNV